MRRAKVHYRAFTLAELLSVIVVIAIVTGLLLASLGRSKELARKTRCLAQLNQLGLALSLYGDDHQGVLPMAHASVTWDSQKPPAWTRLLLNYYQSTNLLACPTYRRFHQRSPFSYFMGARAAFIEGGGQPASVLLTRVFLPSQYILSGDCNYPFAPDDADPDNYTYDTLFGTNLLAHHGGINILFADNHVLTARQFDPQTMTYSYITPGMDWSNWEY